MKVQTLYKLPETFIPFTGPGHRLTNNIRFTSPDKVAGLALLLTGYFSERVVTVLHNSLHACQDLFTKTPESRDESTLKTNDTVLPLLSQTPLPASTHSKTSPEPAPSEDAKPEPTVSLCFFDSSSWFEASACFVHPDLKTVYEKAQLGGIFALLAFLCYVTKRTESEYHYVLPPNSMLKKPPNLSQILTAKPELALELQLAAINPQTHTGSYNYIRDLEIYVPTETLQKLSQRENFTIG